MINSQFTLTFPCVPNTTTILSLDWDYKTRWQPIVPGMNIMQIWRYMSYCLQTDNNVNHFITHTETSFLQMADELKGIPSWTTRKASVYLWYRFCTSLELYCRHEHKSSQRYSLSWCIDDGALAHNSKISYRSSTGLRSGGCDWSHSISVTLHTFSSSSNHSVWPYALWTRAGHPERNHYQEGGLSEFIYLFIINLHLPFPLTGLKPVKFCTQHKSPFFTLSFVNHLYVSE